MDLRGTHCYQFYYLINYDSNFDMWSKKNYEFLQSHPRKIIGTLRFAFIISHNINPIKIIIHTCAHTHTYCKCRYKRIMNKIISSRILPFSFIPTHFQHIKIYIFFFLNFAVAQLLSYNEEDWILYLWVLLL